MSRIIRAASAASLAAALVGAPLSTSHAQERPGWHPALAAGASFPTGRFDDRVSAGGGLLGSAEYKLGKLPFGLRGDLAYDQFGLQSGYVAQFPGADGGHVGMTSGTLNVVWHAPRVANLQPYALLGGGAYRRHVELDSPGPTTVLVDPFWGVVSVDPTQVVDRSHSVTKLGANAGLGLGYRVGGSTVFAEAQYQTEFTAQRTRYVPLVVGLRW